MSGYVGHVVFNYILVITINEYPVSYETLYMNAKHTTSPTNFHQKKLPHSGERLILAYGAVAKPIMD